MTAHWKVCNIGQPTAIMNILNNCTDFQDIKQGKIIIVNIGPVPLNLGGVSSSMSQS